jgi:hypothetical protein
VRERRPERNGSVRVVYGACIVHCRPCPLRALCQESLTTKKPRQVSAVLWPVQPIPSLQPPAHPPLAAFPPPEPLAIHPVLWGDWPRSRLRRTLLRTLHTQTVEITFRSLPLEEIHSAPSEDVQTRAARAHWRLSWQQRLARNARSASAPVLEILIYGLPAALALYIQSGGISAA